MKTFAYAASAVYFLFIFSLAYGSYAHALEVQVPKVVDQGAPFWAEIKVKKNVQSIRITWLKKSFVLPARHKEKQVLLAAGLKCSGKKLLLVEAGDRGRVKKWVLIRKKEFPAQYLRLPEKMVTPPKKVLDRIYAEKKLITMTLEKISPVRYFQSSFVWPVKSKILSVFGLRRFLNNKPRSPHRGIDLRAPLNTPIRAFNAGQVALIGEFYFGGKTVIIDHGLGVYSIYMHLNKIKVKKGQVVSRAEIIGLAGKTGRATGPHLHFALSVLGQLADPVPLLKGNSNRAIAPKF